MQVARMDPRGAMRRICLFSGAVAHIGPFHVAAPIVQDLHGIVMGVLVGPAAAAAADVLKVFPVSSRAARLVMSKVVRRKKVSQRPSTSLCLPRELSCQLMCRGVAACMPCLGLPAAELVRKPQADQADVIDGPMPPATSLEPCLGHIHVRFPPVMPPSCCLGRWGP